VDPVPDPAILKKSCSAGNRTLTSASVARNYSGSVDRNYDHYSTDAVYGELTFITNVCILLAWLLIYKKIKLDRLVVCVWTEMFCIPMRFASYRSGSLLFSTTCFKLYIIYCLIIHNY
jgi:hypothetical protein